MGTPAVTPAEPELPPPDLCRCAACGYRLDGLPRFGRCPECGASFDRSEIVLVGRSAGPSRAWWLQPLPAMFICLGAGGVVADLIRGRISTQHVVPLTILGLGLASLLIRYIRRQRSGRTGDIAVRIARRGVGAMADPPDAAAVPLTPWSRVTRLRLVPKRNGRLWIWVRCGDLDLFDALVECPPEQVPALRRIIGGWFNG